MQELFDERLEYGFHDVFTLAALLDPELYPYVHTIPMAERVKAEELVMKLYGSSKSFGKAALGQLKSYREGNHGIPDYALENPALVADGVGFWRDYGTDNPALRHIAKVAIRVLGIPPTAAGMLYTVNASYILPWTFAWCMNSGPTTANSSAADFVFTCSAGGERGWSAFRRVWSDDRELPLHRQSGPPCILPLQSARLGQVLQQPGLSRLGLVHPGFGSTGTHQSP